MATFAELEDLRDWCEDTLGEFLSRIGVLEGDEDQAIVKTILTEADCVKRHGLDVISGLEALIVLKKKAEYDP